MRDSLGRRERPRRLGRRLLILVVVLAIAAGVGLVLWGGTEGPRATLAAPIRLVGTDTPLRIDLSAGRSGLSSLRVVARDAGGSQTILAEETIPSRGLLGSGVRSRRLAIDLNARLLGLQEGRGRVEVYARDHAALGVFDDEEVLLEVPIIVDLTPPEISVRGSTHYVRAGGSDLVVYEVGEDTQASGVVVGETEFPGEHLAELPPNRRVALYAIPHDAAADLAPRVFATDKVGNRSSAPFPVVVRQRDFPAEDVQISENFIAQTVRPLLAASDEPQPSDPVGAFLAVNRGVRAQSEAEIKRLTAKSEPHFHPAGAFRQQPGTKVGSRFAEERTYFVEGEVVDQQTHLGYDLASVRQAPIVAAQAGVVQASLDLGIYGKVVLVDHGMGLSSLYAHLSSSDVAPGDRVEIGDRLGRSGETGLASGDHLHFSILVRGNHVDPIEWWDASWVERKIRKPLAEASRRNGADRG